MKFAVRLLLGVFIIFISLLLFKHPVLAQTSQSSFDNVQVQQKLTTNTDSDVPVNLHTWTQNVMIEVLSALSCQLTGTDPSSPSGQCLGVNPKTGKIGYVQGGGAITGLGKMIGYLYTPIISSGDYVHYLSVNFGIAKPTYAQGVGFNQISPLASLWTKFRDIAYAFFVMVFVAVGLAIMLRVRIDARTVMTLQNQIPKMIIGIILITFSFAIAGLLVDLMWVGTYTAVNVIGSADTPAFSATSASNALARPVPVFANEFLAGGDTSGGLHNVASQASNSVNEMIAQIFGDIFAPNSAANQQQAAGGGCSWWILCPISNTIGNIAGWVGQNALNFFGGILSAVFSQIIGFVAFLIFAIAIIISLFRLWFQLIKAYIFVLVDIVFAPVWIIGGLIPGAGGVLGFGSWIRDLLGNLSAFPAVVVMFSIGKVFVDNAVAGGTGISTFTPPLLGFQGTNIISGLIAFGVILATPEVVNITKKAFKSPPISLGPIGRSLGAGAGAVNIVGHAQKVGMSMYYAQYIPFVGGRIAKLTGRGKGSSGAAPGAGGGGGGDDHVG